MKVCLLYSGWVRTYDRCMANHIQNLKADSIHTFHVNETNTEIDYYKTDFDEFSTNKAPETVARHTINQWRNNYLVFNKAANDFDVYCRIRYDIVLSGLIDFTEYEYRDNLIYIPYGHDYRDGINDMFAFGNYNTMQQYFTLYLKYRDIFSEGVQFHTETFVKHNLKNMEIVRMPITTTIIR